MTDQSTALDADELMHLALHATENGMPDKALMHLKRLITIEPDNAKAHYLIGALHAQIGMHSQAADEMARALDLDPGLHTARFQLGLLYITSGKVEEAEQVFSSLDDLGDNNPLYQFKKGILHLVRDEFDLCTEALQAGIAMNTFNEDLNNDMRRVLHDARKAMEKKPAISSEPDSEKATDKGRHILLSAYDRKETDDY